MLPVDKFPPKTVLWLYGIFLLGTVPYFLYRSNEDAQYSLIGALLFVFAGYLLFMTNRSGIEIRHTGFVYRSLRNEHVVDWDEVSRVIREPWRDWRRRSVRNWLRTSHSVDLYGRDDVITLVLADGKEVALMPIYKRQKEFLALLKKMAPAAKG